MTEQTATQELVMTRVFDAPRDLVFDAWMDPDQVAKWWGPGHGFSTPRESVEIDRHVGGRYNLVMIQGGTGREYPLRCEIVELVEPELLAFRSQPEPQIGMPDAVLTRVELHDEDGKTRMTLTAGPYTESQHAEAGWSVAFDALNRLLAG